MPLRRSAARAEDVHHAADRVAAVERRAKPRTTSIRSIECGATWRGTGSARTEGRVAEADAVDHQQHLVAGQAAHERRAAAVVRLLDEDAGHPRERLGRRRSGSRASSSASRDETDSGRSNTCRFSPRAVTVSASSTRTTSGSRPISIGAPAAGHDHGAPVAGARGEQANVARRGLVERERPGARRSPAAGSRPARRRLPRGGLPRARPGPYREPRRRQRNRRGGERRGAQGARTPGSTRP